MQQINVAPRSAHITVFDQDTPPCCCVDRTADIRLFFVRFADGHPVAEPEDILTGFLSTDGNA